MCTVASDKHMADWRFSLCDPQIYLSRLRLGGNFCVSCIFGRTENLLDGVPEGDGCGNACCFYFTCPPIAGCIQRTRIRLLRNIPGDCCADFCCALWCGANAVVQQYLEVASNPTVVVIQQQAPLQEVVVQSTTTTTPVVQPQSVYVQQPQPVYVQPQPQMYVPQPGYDPQQPGYDPQQQQMYVQQPGQAYQ